ncbi:MAG: GNAT family N-acetyltransferase [Bacteroidetes bacterium]|nr:GNAT family N-acetyltransferase [Bacteroidota bacterium]
MQSTFHTSRLSLKKLSTSDAAFIQELVNTPGWLQFIGNRNVNSAEDAIAYIQKILDNENVTYWIARLKGSLIPIGVVTLIQRDYLAHPDIGFAFLPAYSGTGYAREATEIVIQALQAENASLLAITIPENSRSVKLLQTIGFNFEKELQQDGETLLVYRLWR